MIFLSELSKGLRAIQAREKSVNLALFWHTSEHKPSSAPSIVSKVLPLPLILVNFSHTHPMPHSHHCIQAGPHTRFVTDRSGRREADESPG